jgi:hypothetical protein
MAAALVAYRVVAGLGVVALTGFALVALFAPDMLSLVIGVEHIEFSYVWLGNVGMLLAATSLFSIAALRDPEKLAAYAWLGALGHCTGALYWMRVLHDPHGQDFWPWALLDASLGVVPAIFLQIGLPAEARLGPHTMARIRAAFAQPASNGRLRAFRRVVGLGLVVNVGFIVSALFAPGVIKSSVGAQFVDLAPVWLGAAGVMLLAVSLLYVPLAADPESAPGVAWLAVISWFVVAAYWVSVATQPDRGAFWGYVASDLVIGLLLAFFLQTGSAPENRLSGASVARVLQGAVAAITLKSQPLALKVVGAVLAIGAAAGGYVGWYYFVRQVPDTVFANPEDQYKYGVIGLGPASRIPLYVWDVMPEVCSDALPDPKRGWASFGLIYEPGHDTPVGFAKREIGYPSVEPNCSLCHTGTFRASATDAPRTIPGGPAHALDLEGFQRFLYACASSPHFTADTVMSAMQKKHPMGAVESAVYRFGVLPAIQSGLARQDRDYQWQRTRPVQGSGRTDTFNPTKISVFHLPDDGTIGTVDLPAVWNQQPREKLWLHWDGNNDQIRERNFAAAMAVGATPKSVVLESFTKVTDYLLQLPAAKYPFPVDAQRAARGKVTYDKQCASCHAFGSSQIGQTTTVEELGTDRHRLDSFTAGLVSYFHEIDLGHFKFDGYRKTDGYSNLPIDGIWARAPYLHNGSVPTLRDLLSPPAQRPRVFYRGIDLYDSADVGFVTTGPEAQAAGFKFDVTIPGNDNGGHLYGTELAPEDKSDLLEYLKTL